MTFAAKQTIAHKIFCVGSVDLMETILGYPPQQSQTLSE